MPSLQMAYGLMFDRKQPPGYLYLTYTSRVEMLP